MISYHYVQYQKKLMIQLLELYIYVYIYSRVGTIIVGSAPWHCEEGQEFILIKGILYLLQE